MAIDVKINGVGGGAEYDAVTEQADGLARKEDKKLIDTTVFNADSFDNVLHDNATAAFSVIETNISESRPESGSLISYRNEDGGPEVARYYKQLPNAINGVTPSNWCRLLDVSSLSSKYKYFAVSASGADGKLTYNLSTNFLKWDTYVIEGFDGTPSNAIISDEAVIMFNEGEKSLIYSKDLITWQRRNFTHKIASVKFIDAFVYNVQPQLNPIDFTVMQRTKSYLKTLFVALYNDEAEENYIYSIRNLGAREYLYTTIPYECGYSTKAGRIYDFCWINGEKATFNTEWQVENFAIMFENATAFCYDMRYPFNTYIDYTTPEGQSNYQNHIVHWGVGAKGYYGDYIYARTLSAGSYCVRFNTAFLPNELAETTAPIYGFYSGTGWDITMDQTYCEPQGINTACSRAYIDDNGVCTILVSTTTNYSIYKVDYTNTNNRSNITINGIPNGLVLSDFIEKDGLIFAIAGGQPAYNQTLTENRCKAGYAYIIDAKTGQAINVDGWHDLKILTPYEWQIKQVVSENNPYYLPGNLFSYTDSDMKQLWDIRTNGKGFISLCLQISIPGEALINYNGLFACEKNNPFPNKIKSYYDKNDFIKLYDDYFYITRILLYGLVITKCSICESSPGLITTFKLLPKLYV